MPAADSATTWDEAQSDTIQSDIRSARMTTAV